MTLQQLLQRARRSETAGAFVEQAARWFFRFDFIQPGRGVKVTPGRDGVVIEADFPVLQQEAASNYPDSHQVKTDSADPAADYLAAKVQHSLAADATAHKLQLAGDAETPGASQYYGTSPGGVRGWQALPAADDRKVKASGDDATPDFLDGKAQHSLVVDAATQKLQLAGDTDAPGASQFYGTNAAGARGWQAVPTIPDADDRKVKGSATDGSPDYLDGKVKRSLAVDDDQLQLAGDEDTPDPAAAKYYGFDGAGTRGFHSLPTDSDEQVKADEGDETPGPLADKVQHSVVVDATAHKLQLAADAAAPGSLKLYGTDGAGTKGWQGTAEVGVVTSLRVSNGTLQFKATTLVVVQQGTVGDWEDVPSV